MCNKQKVFVFIGFHLTLLICLIGTSNDGVFMHSSILNLWYPLIIYFIGLVVYGLTYYSKAALFFYTLLTVVSLVLSLPVSNVTYIMLSLLPLLTYRFCLEFFQVDEMRMSRVLTRIISSLTLFLVISYFFANATLDYFGIFNIFIFSNITLHILCDVVFLCLIIVVLCGLMFLSAKNKNIVVLRFSKLLMLMAFIGALPYPIFIVLNLTISNFPIHMVDGLYTFIVLPITVGYILLQENSIMIYYTKHEIKAVVAVAIFVLLADVLFLLHVLHLSEQGTVIVLLVYLLGIYLVASSVKCVSYHKVDNINENLYENRKTEFLYQLRFQELLRNYIMFVLHQLKYKGYHDTLICTRRYKKIELFDENSLISIEAITDYFDLIITEGDGELVIDGVPYLIMIFLNRPNEQGFLAVRKPTVSFATLQREVAHSLQLLEQIYQLEFLKQNYKSLPGIRPQEFVIEKYQYEINRIQQEESQYLHDVVLQKMLSIKNFLEIIEIPNVELKEDILDEIRDLNSSMITHMYDLFPFTLKNLSLYDCISELMTRLKKTTEYQQSAPNIRLSMNRTLKVPRYFFYPIYSFIKQLLWNIFSFSEATFVDIQLAVEHEHIIIKISDNGNRMNMQDLIYADNSRKNGILIINYEVKELNGQLFTELNHPTGSIITIKLPYKGEVNSWT